MGDWFKRRWKSIEGRVLWALLAIVGAGVLTLAPVQALEKWLHQPVSNLGVWLWSCSSSLVVALFIVWIRDRTPAINIEVTMDDGNAAHAGLTVTNLGGEHQFRAEAQIVKSNRPDVYPRGLFRLGWDSGPYPHVNIPRHASERIILGSFEDISNAHSLMEMRIWTQAGSERQVQWWARWIVEEKEDLPYFQLKVTVIAEGTRKPWVKTFLLSPKTRLGPLGISPVEVTA